MSQLATLTHLDNGTVRMDLTEEGRSEIDALLNNDQLDTDSKLLELLEYEICNGWTVILDQVALCSDMLLSDEIDWDDDGSLTIPEGQERPVWFDADGWRRDPIKELAETGFIILAQNFIS